MFFDDSIKKVKSELEGKISSIEDQIRILNSKFPENHIQLINDLKRIKNECSNLLSQITGIHSVTIEQNKEFQESCSDVKIFCENYESKIEILEKRKSALDIFYSEVDQKEIKLKNDLDSIKAGLEEVTGYLNSSKEFPVKIKELENLVQELESKNATVDQITSSVLKKKNDIDLTHKEILGHDIKNANGEVEHVDGLKDELSNAIVGMEVRVKALSENYNKEIDAYKKEYEERLNANKDKFLDLIKSTQDYINETKDRILDLLPGAMAAGLSHAYEEKRVDEVASLVKAEKRFLKAIFSLIIISALPVVIAVYILQSTEKNLFEVIDYLPKLMSAFFPLYIPVFWVAYSTNKKINLSKRIIEEYTHKEVLGKTFSGLSNQIDKTNNDAGLQSELRMKLLFNFMQVTSENPGKLISDYNSADHPVMDAIEKSAKLTDALERIARIPGFGPVAKKLAEKAEEVIDRTTKKVEDGINTNDLLNKDQKDKLKEDVTT